MDTHRHLGTFIGHSIRDGRDKSQRANQLEHPVLNLFPAENAVGLGSGNGNGSGSGSGSGSEVSVELTFGKRGGKNERRFAICLDS